jgi:UDP-2,4-diacetamido-2,4,6-trideoxy-beta-L-altropyranose hydrolase
MKKVIKIRVDSDDKIGLGHLYRTIAITQILNSDFDFHFFSKSQSTIQLLEGYNFNFTQIDCEQIFLQTLNTDDIVIIDGYEFKSEFELQIKKSGCLLICIDDLNDHHFFADIIINHGVRFKEKDFKVQPNTKIFLGLKYILVREEFLAKSSNKYIDRNKLETVFISFGGTSNFSIVESAINAFERLNFKKINIVFGNINDYESVKLKYDHINCFTGMNPNEIINLMCSADLAFLPASTILLESFCVGLPIISGWVAENQNFSLSVFENKNMVINLGNLHINLEEKLQNALQESSMGILNRLGRNQKCEVGSSYNNIKKIFTSASATNL